MNSETNLSIVNELKEHVYEKDLQLIYASLNAVYQLLFAAKRNKVEAMHVATLLEPIKEHVSEAKKHIIPEANHE